MLYSNCVFYSRDFSRWKKEKVDLDPMLFVGEKKRFKWLNKICNIQFYSRYKKFFIYLKLYLVSKDSTAKTHRHDILDKVLLPVLLPSTRN